MGAVAIVLFTLDLRHGGVSHCLSNGRERVALLLSWGGTKRKSVRKIKEERSRENM